VEISGLRAVSARLCQWTPQSPWLSSCMAGQGMHLCGPHCAAGLGSEALWEHIASGRSWSLRRPDRRDPSHVYPGTSGIRSLLAASGCTGLEMTRTTHDRKTRGQGSSRRWWQVLGSNQRRLSRRSYRPLPLPPGQRAADQHLEPPEGIADAAIRYGDRVQGNYGLLSRRLPRAAASAPCTAPYWSRPIGSRYQHGFSTRLGNDRK
jgi:hypothetical protein